MVPCRSRRMANGCCISRCHQERLRTSSCCRPAANGKPRAIVQSPFPDVEPQLSPDGRWLAYASTETGRNEVYVQPFPPTGARWQVSSAGGRQPLWRADGKELFFVSDDRRFYAVDISDKSGVFDYGVPQFLFEMRANVFNSRNSYVPSRDGQRFLVNMLLEADDSPSMSSTTGRRAWGDRPHVSARHISRPRFRGPSTTGCQGVWLSCQCVPRCFFCFSTIAATSASSFFAS